MSYVRPCTCGAAPTIGRDLSGRYLVECHACVDGAIDSPARPYGQNAVEADAISDWNDAISDLADGVSPDGIALTLEGMARVVSLLAEPPSPIPALADAVRKARRD